MVLKALIVLVALIAVSVGVVLALAAVKPRTFQIRRSIVIAAPSDRVYGLISDFHNWPQWAPQDREDSTMQRTFGGAASGNGAVSEWQSKGSAGAGRMEITDAQPSNHLTIRVDWVRPFKARNINEFRLQSEGPGTRVTWIMDGPNLLPMRAMAVFVDMDKMMGKHFDAGLENLKAVAETR